MPRRARIVLTALVLLLLAIVAVYPAAYIHARVTHRLVRYEHLGGPMSLGPPWIIEQGGLREHARQPCWEERVFAPLSFLELMYWSVRG